MSAKRSLLVWSAMFSALACSAGDHRSSEESILVDRLPAAPLVDPAVPGYQHVFQKSKFVVGSGQAMREEFGMTKIVGDRGVFAVRKSGLATALANGDAPERRRPPIGDANSHDNAVRDYFVAQGLPADQILEVKGFEVVGAPVGDAPPTEPVKGTVEYRYSLITRQIHGIPVPDSLAWARLNVDGAVVEEQVYWPPIPQSVVRTAQSFASHLNDANFQAQVHAAVPSRASAGALVIRHSPGEWDHDFVADALFDVVRRGSFPRTFHITPAGAVRLLPFEQEGAWGSLPVAKRPPRQ